MDRGFRTSGHVYHISSPNIKSFEIYEPPRKKIKKWLWVRKYGSANEELTRNFYSSKEKAQQGCSAKVLFKAEWSEIEVEE